MKAVNWNKQDDLTLLYWRQNIAQFWVDTEFKPSKDIKSWNEDLNEKEREAYKKVLAGLTGLDTQQGDIGMPLISIHTEDSRKQAVYSFMGMMEQIHAKSYSTIFTSLIPSKETNYLLEEWVPNNEHLQYKGRRIENYYLKLLKPDPTYYEQYMARVASIFLESYIFYSGFFYPLYLAGQGKVTTSGEIIRKILLDETIHGSFTGIDAQEIYQNKLTIDERKKADQEMYKLLLDLYENELEYSKTIYEEIGLYEEVKDYIEYNANRALANLGFTGYFEEKDINPIIENAVNTSTKNHDFFSVKGDGYVVSLNVEAMEDEDFIF